MIDWSKTLAPGQRTVRVYTDEIEQRGGLSGLTFLHAGTGIYRLSGHPDLATGRVDAVPFAHIQTTWADDALVLWVTCEGDLTDIPAGSWITINL